MRFFDIRRKEFIAVNLESVFPEQPPVNFLTIHRNNPAVSRRHTIDPWVWWELVAAYVECITVQGEYATHWATEDQIALVLVNGKCRFDMTSIVTSYDEFQVDVSGQMLSNKVVYVSGPLTEYDTRRGTQFMVMDVEGTVAGI